MRTQGQFSSRTLVHFPEAKDARLFFVDFDGFLAP